MILPVAASSRELPQGYGEFLAGVKEQRRSERLRAVLSANSALVLMYWDIGTSILKKQKVEGWGARVIDRLSSDLKDAFPEMKGFSATLLDSNSRFLD